MGFIFNFIKRLVISGIKLTLYLGVFATIIVLIPNLPPYTKFSSIEQTPAQPRVGPLEPNNALNNAEQRFKGKLLGPEAFQIMNGELYTSLATGEIVKISPGGHVTFVTKVGLPCSGILKEHICGRPLGFEIDEKDNKLYVADAYYGIWKVDLKTDKKQLLVSPKVEIAKRAPKMFNSITLDKNGDFYWTDSTSDFNLKDAVYSTLCDPSGRVFHYSAAKNESKVLVDNLWLANGLALSPNKEFLVISESGRFRLLKHYLSGLNKGKTEVFIDGLPGVPDNIRVLPDGSGILVALYSASDDEHPLLMRSLATTPVVRKFIARLQRLIEIPFEYLHSVYPHVVFEEIVYHIGHFKSISGFLPPISGLVQADWNGNIVASYFNTDRSLGHISEAIVYNDKLYTGSPHQQDYIGALPVPPLLKKAFENREKVKAPKVDAKSQQAKPVEPAKSKVEGKPKAQAEQKKAKDEVKSNVEQKSKVDEKPKVEQKPKEGQKPKVVEKPKVEQKLKVESKPKLEETSKSEERSTVRTKPKSDEKEEVPKVVKSENKPRQQNEPVTPVQVKSPEQAPKPTASPPKTTTPPATAQLPTTTPKPQQQPKATTTPKVEAKTTPPPKPTEKTTPPPKPTTKKAEEPKKAQVPTKPSQGTANEEIPIKEEILSDTAKPSKETLKVIKKGGIKAEIPVHNSL